MNVSLNLTLRFAIISDPRVTFPRHRHILSCYIAVLLSVPYNSDESFADQVTKRLYQSCMESNMNGDTALGDLTRKSCNVAFYHSIIRSFFHFNTFRLPLSKP